MEGDRAKSHHVCNICDEELADARALRNHYNDKHGSDEWSQIPFATQNQESSPNLTWSARYHRRLKPWAPSKQTGSMEDMPSPGNESPAAPRKKTRTETEEPRYSKAEKAKGPSGTGKRSFKPSETSTPLSLPETDNVTANPVQPPSHEFDFWAGKPLPMHKKIWFGTRIDAMNKNVQMVSRVGFFSTIFKQLYRDWLNSQVLSKDVRESCNRHIQTLMDLQRESKLRGHFEPGQWINFNSKDHFIPYELDEMVDPSLNRSTARGIAEAHKHLLELIRVMLHHAREKGDISQEKLTQIDGQLGYQRAKLKLYTQSLNPSRNKDEETTFTLLLPPIPESGEEEKNEDHQITADDSFEALVAEGCLSQEEEKKADTCAPNMAEQHRASSAHTQCSDSDDDWISYQPR